MRDAVLSLACLRHGTVPTGLDPADLHRAFVATTDALLTEAHHTDPARTARLAPLLRELAAP